MMDWLAKAMGLPSNLLNGSNSEGGGCIQVNITYFGWVCKLIGQTITITITFMAIEVNMMTFHHLILSTLLVLYFIMSLKATRLIQNQAVATIKSFF